jgi:phosphoenolpyruvate carboxylase
MSRTLSNDIRWVGDTLGHVLRAHAGEALFGHVEAMRLSAKAAREGDHEPERAAARERLAQVAGALAAGDALEVVRAFTLYFQLVNLAEDVQRTRELRRREIEAGLDQVAESLHATVGELQRAGVARGTVLAALERLHVSFVFTAHPTEARRRTTERLLARAREALEARERRQLAPLEVVTQERRLRAAIEALWEHAAERSARPDVLEEVKAGLWYLRNVLLDAVPRLFRRLDHALGVHYGPGDAASWPMVLSFGSWMGGDRDGNPFVTDAVTERALELHRFIILERYVADLDGLVDPLAAAVHRLEETPRLARALERAQAAVPELLAEAERRNPEEPLRRLITFMRERLVRTRTFSAGAYASPRAFLDDLEVIRETLQLSGAIALMDDGLLELILRVRCFGFHLAALDVREDSRVHRRVIGELLDDPGYAARPDEERRRLLTHLSLPDRGRALSDDAIRLLDLFDTLRRLQARFGGDALGAYIISRTESAADVLEVVRLFELHGLHGAFDVVPLFETHPALSAAEGLVAALFDDPAYAAQLERRGRQQEILVGYSDSMKEIGILASRVAILDVQRRLAALCRARGVGLRIFHGRGGSVSRGGGPTYRAIRALPGDGFVPRMKITEQGETRAFHFADPDLALRYLEQSLGAALTATLDAEAVAAPSPDESALLDTLARHSRAAYRALVEDEGLIPYFREATPFEAIASLQMASRPARRGDGVAGLDDLRAIPWVFAWSQCRAVVTGWYGVGSALSAVAAQPGGTERLAALYRGSPFFRDLLDNVQITLAKTELPIAERYAALCGDAAVRDRIFGRIKAEHDRTGDLLLKVMGQAELLADDAVLRRSIQLRNPYVDPLSYLQVEALRHMRAAADPAAREPWAKVARVAVQGIAAGLRNTG